MMQVTMEDHAYDMTGAAYAYNGFLSHGLTSAALNPQYEAMNPLRMIAVKEQADGLAGARDLMHEMLTAIHQIPDESTHVDMGGKDNRPGDLTANFDPKMDQDIKLYTGGGDDMVIIV